MMVVAEIGLSLVLLSAAAILVRSAIRLESVKLAFDIKPLSVSWLRWTTSRDTVVRYADISSEFVSRVRGLPDVDDAAVTFFHGLTAATAYGADGAPRSIGANGYRVVSPSFARTMHLKILKGRNFLDGYSSEAEVIIDQKSAKASGPVSIQSGGSSSSAKPTHASHGSGSLDLPRTWRIRRSSSRRGRAGFGRRPWERCTSADCDR